MKRGLLLLLVVLSAAAALIYYFVGRRSSDAHSAAIPELLLSAPADASTLLYVDAAALRSSPFLSELLALVPAPREDAEYIEFVKATNFDYSRDLERAALFSQSGPERRVIAVADGRFDQKKIAAYALRLGKITKQNGRDVYTISSGQSPRPVSFALLSPGRILLENAPALEPQLFTPSNNSLSAEQRARLQRVGGSAIIVVSRIASSAGASGPLAVEGSFFGFRSQDLNKLLRNIRWLTLAARPDGSRLKVLVEGECDAPEQAAQVARTAETLRLLARILLSDSKTRQQLHPQELALLDCVVRDGEIRQMENRVQLRFEVSAGALAAPTPSKTQ